MSKLKITNSKDQAYLLFDRPSGGFLLPKKNTYQLKRADRHQNILKILPYILHTFLDLLILPFLQTNLPSLQCETPPMLLEQG